MHLQNTLGNEQWLKNNETAIKEILPKTWTNVSNLSGLQIGFKLKLLGVDWRTNDEFGRIMVFLEKIGILLRDGIIVKRNPHSVFS